MDILHVSIRENSICVLKSGSGEYGYVRAVECEETVAEKIVGGDVVVVTLPGGGD